MPKFLTERTAVRIDYVFRLQHYYDHESQNFQVHLIYLDLYLNIDRSFQPINTYTKTNLIYQKKIIAQMGLLKKISSLDLLDLKQPNTIDPKKAIHLCKNKM